MMQLYKMIFLFLFYPIFSYIPQVYGGRIGATVPRFVSQMEASMAKVIKNYVELERRKLDQLEEHSVHLEQRSKHHNTSEQNPIWLYRTVETLINEWQHLEHTMKSTSFSEVEDLPKPDSDHLTDIAIAIYRIQDVYRFSEMDIASGLVRGWENAGGFSARDCYNLAINAFSMEDYYHSILWLEEAESRINQEGKQSVESNEITAVLAMALKKIGKNKKRVKKLISEFLQGTEEKKIEEMVEKFPDLNELLEEGRKDQYNTSTSKLPPLINDRLDWDSILGQPEYETLCRQGYQNQFHTTSSKYTCQYVKNTPYLMLAPVKLEHVLEDPPVSIYRQIISDQELEEIIWIDQDKFTPSRVFNNTKGGVVMKDERDSYTALFSHEAHPVVQTVRTRVGLVTGLSMQFAEKFQLTKYGIGGHYSPHYDYFGRNTSERNYTGSGDRIATLLFYLIEPEHGGGTAFPYVNLVVKPTKNDALFWYNLQQSGEGHENVLHAGCPVVSGSKLVANQWIREKGQEFRRRCGLVENM